MTRTLVIGVGNRWRGDDAAGLAVADALERGPLPAGVRVARHEGEPVGLLDAWRGHDAVVLVDAVVSGAPEGTIHRLDAGGLAAKTFGNSTHAVGLADAIELARALERLPPRLELYGIEGDAFTPGGELTPSVARAVQALADELRRRLARRGSAAARGS